MKILSVFGTRPEAIKMCPLIKVLERTSNIESVVCVTGQHREMLWQVIDLFGICVKYNLDIMTSCQTLTNITNSILDKMEDVFKEEKPDIVLVHGDTTTSFAVTLAAFYQHIPVGHVEAGLRTNNMQSPFPEEMNRCLTDRISTYHFAPTDINKDNLLHEGINENIFVTGNTIVDALKYTVSEDYSFKNERLKSLDNIKNRIILVTAHRRENWGEPIRNVCNAIIDIVNKYSDVEVIFPVHLNPVVRDTVELLLGGVERVTLLPPIDVFDMHNLISKSYLVMTDSGGIQEEAPSFGVPILVLRTETERKEVVEAGMARVVGTNRNKIFVEADKLLSNEVEYKKMISISNPYGDGHASERIVEILCKEM